DAIVGLAPALDGTITSQKVVGDVLSVQSVGVNGGGDAIITFDAPGGVGGIIIVDDLADSPVSGPLGLGDRVIFGPSTGLVAPRGVEANGPGGVFLVADVGAPAIKAYSLAASGDVAPEYEVTDLGTSEAVWDVHYVGGNTDTLYAAGINGEVQVYEEFSVDLGAAGPTYTIVPVENGNKVSVNLHGITVVNDTLYLTDVGDPMDSADGQIFVISGLNNAMGDTEVDQRIQGGMLGNPVDLEIRTGGMSRIFVAEKANDLLLSFTFNAMAQAWEPSTDLAVTKPESVALATNNRLIMASNPAGLDADRILEIETPGVGQWAIDAILDQIGSVTSIQSVTLNAAGDGFVTFDGPPPSDGGGVFAVPGLAGLMDEGEVSAVLARIWGPQTDVIRPKGLALGGAGTYLFVADISSESIKVFDPAAVGDTPPLFTFAELGGNAVWDVAYDDANDRLFAAGTDGVIRVWDNAVTDQGQNPPTRLIIPAMNGSQISVNLHGIAYDPTTDMLIVSDVGDPMASDDGAIYIFADASTVSDETDPVAWIAGDQTQLGNPVDIAFDGENLYVAEKANSLVLRFNGVLGLAGEVNQAADASIDAPSVESVALLFSAP
ncbi:MAG TPA: hypothetical protein VIK91_23415, partial [Nannocystis sp.]